MSSVSVAPPACAHRMLYRVCYGDTDRMGRVYYANYLVFCERARTEMLREAGVPYSQMERDGVFLPVRQCAVRYFGYAEYDDELSFCSWVTRLRRATICVTTAVCRPGQEAKPLVLAEVELACIDEGGTPLRLPEETLSALAPYVVLGS